MADPNDDLKIIEGVKDVSQGIEVNLDLDTGKDAAGEAAKAGDVDHHSSSADDGINSLKAQVATERRQREEERRLRIEAEDRARRAEEQTVDGQARLIANSLDAAKAQRAQAKADLKSAAEVGDWTKHADAQEALNDAQIRMDRLERGKEELERRAEAEKNRPAQRAERRPASNDPVEMMIAETGLPSKSADWIRRHPQCVTDDRMNAKMISAHNLAALDDLALESPEYFAFIEKQLGIRNRDEGGDAPQREPARKDAPRAPAAPPSRGAPNGRGSASNTVTLSPAERSYCDETGTTYADYARSKVALIKEGRLKEGTTH